MAEQNKTEYDDAKISWWFSLDLNLVVSESIELGFLHHLLEKCAIYSGYSIASILQENACDTEKYIY